MKKIIAVPFKDDKVFQHFGHSEAFKLYKIQGQEILESQVVSTNGTGGHGLLAEFLNTQGVSVLICGGIGGGAKEALGLKSIEILPGVEGDADIRVEEYLLGKLIFDPTKECTSHGEGHDHSHDCGGHH